MKTIHLKRMTVMAATLAALCSTGTAFAQYVWIDERGVKQFSDMPPPATIPASRILKQPGSKPVDAAEGATPSPPQPSKPEMTTAEKNAEFRKRKTEQAEKEKKAAEETRVASEKAKYCERARDYLRALESGERLTHTDRNGERAFLSDEQRQRETKETRRIVQDCK